MKPRAVSNPKNRFSSTEVAYDEGESGTRIEIHDDHAKSILASNESPDVGFRWSLNPYRGCGHACAYCYARPSHEYLGLGAGTDFDTRIFAKKQAASLLREALEKKSWLGETIVFSGVTDCYQPAEKELQLTRQCLEVCAEYRNPVGIITKSPLVERDLALLQELTRVASVRVNVSIPFWDAEHARAIEPFVATPQRRIETIRRLADAGIAVGVGVSPIIPGLSDEDMPRILEAAKEAGATRAFYVLLRLPGAVKEVFEERLRKELPERAERVLHRIRETRGGELYDSRFGVRGVGTGLYAKTIETLFDITTRRLGLNEAQYQPTERKTFRRPERAGTQLKLF